MTLRRNGPVSALRSPRNVWLFADHPAMGAYGMLAGWLATAQPPLVTLCTTRPLADRLLPTVLMHMREHVAMFLGMALANLVSIAIASWVQNSAKGWRQETGRGTRCFVVMSSGMVLGCVAVGEAGIALPGVPGASALLMAMVVGALLACVAERLCRDGISMAGAGAWLVLARPAPGGLSR